VAILDTGITTEARTMTFPLWTGSSLTDTSVPFAVNTDMSASKFVKPMDFIFFDEGGPVLDMDGHGTHVASTVSQDTNNGFGLAGIAYNVRVMPVKVCYGYWELMFSNGLDGIPGFEDPDSGGCPFDAVAEGIRYAADNGAKVINISLGGTDPSNTMRAAISYAVGRGVFIAMSMGNEFERGNEIGYPAFYAQQFLGAMSVSAVGRSLKKAYYSSTGSHNEIAAPGGDARDGGSGGVVWQSTLRQADVSSSLVIPRFDRYESTGFQGTSMAAPHVAGLAALLMSRGITDPGVVESIIVQTAKDLGAAGKDDEFGNGLIQPRDALFGRGIR
jgi:serine protease